MYLVDKYKKIDINSIFNLYQFGYLYLSNHLINFNYMGYNSLELRGRLIEKYSESAVALSGTYYSIASIPNILAISDYYYASLLYRHIGDNSRASTLLSNAQKMHNWLEDISVGGRDADEYSLPELAEIGKKRHEVILLNMKDKYDVKSKINDIKKLLVLIGENI